MKFSMLAIAGAALAAGVEGFSAVGPARSFGVRQVSVVLHHMTRYVCPASHAGGRWWLRLPVPPPEEPSP